MVISVCNVLLRVPWRPPAELKAMQYVAPHLVLCSPGGPCRTREAGRGGGGGAGLQRACAAGRGHGPGLLGAGATVRGRGCCWLVRLGREAAVSRASGGSEGAAGVWGGGWQVLAGGLATTRGLLSMHGSCHSEGRGARTLVKGLKKRTLMMDGCRWCVLS